MPPEQQHTGNPGNQYNFIVNPAASPKKPLVPKLGGGSFKLKLAAILGGAFVLIMLMWIIGSFLGGSSLNVDRAIELTQQQQEIIRIAGEGEKSADQRIKNLAVNTKLTVTTQQKEWLNLLARDGVEVKQEQLDLKRNAEADKRLEDARASNTFDIAFLQIIENYMDDYNNSLDAYYVDTTNSTERTLLEKQFGQTGLLIKQLAE